MKLTRRDALKALTAGGIASGGAVALSESAVRTGANRSDSTLSEVDVRTLEAVADAVYPSQVEATPDFVETYVGSLDEERNESISRAVSELNELTRTRYGTEFHEMSSAARDAALRSLGVNRAIPRPDGKRVEAIRYHLVNGLLYALFTTPKGSELVGIQNPVGYPGGYESLLRSPDGEPEGSR